MKKVMLGLTLIMFAFSGLLAQNEEELEEYFSEGQFFFVRGDYEDALVYFLKLVKEKPNNANYNFKTGECYLNIEGKEHLAIPYFEKSLNNIVPKKEYNKRSYNEEAAPLHAYYYLGNAYRINNQLLEALESYQKFIDSPFYYGNYNQTIVDQEIKSCERAKIIQDAPLDLTFTNLGEKINTEFTEEKPVLSGDGNTLVFIRKLQFYDAIFCSRKTGNIWGDPVNINPEILSDGQYYPTGLSQDGSTLLLIKKEDGNTDVYFSVFDGENWTQARELPGKINSFSQETHASFGANDKVIYLSSDRSGSKGGFDIFISSVDSDGEWSKPKNAGKQINTEFDEQVAYFSGDDNVLFFSSIGHYNMGGYDIFYTWKEKKDWHLPINIGYPINTTRNDLFYLPLKGNNRKGLVSLNREDSFGQKDIYLVEILSEDVLSFED